MAHKPSYLIKGKLHPDVLKSLKKVRDIRYVDFKMQEVFDNVFIYDYRAGTTNQFWTLEGKKKLTRYMYCFRALVNYALKYNWHNPSVKIKDYELVDISETLGILYKIDSNVHGTISNIFQITLHYKYIRDKEVPNLFWYNDYLALFHAFTDILHACYWASDSYKNKQKGKAEIAKAS